MDILTQALRENGLLNGRMISPSKSLYRLNNPNNEVYFNANIFSKEGKAWYGDIDITLDSEKLQDVANRCECEIIVLREMDGRFENESNSFDELKPKAVASFSPKLTLFN